MPAEDNLRPDRDPHDYELPPRDLLTAEEEKRHAAQIQQLVDRIAEKFEPMLVGLVDTVPASFDREQILNVARKGLRAGLVSYLVNPVAPHAGFRPKIVEKLR